MSYYYLHPYFSSLHSFALFNDPYFGKSITISSQKSKKAKSLLKENQTVKIEQFQKDKIKLEEKQEVLTRKKIKKQLKALCPDLNKQQKDETVKAKEEFGERKQLNLSNKIKNSNSNLMRMFFRKMEQIFRSQHLLLQRIITKNQIKTSVNKIEEWFEVGKVENKKYIRLKSVKRLFFSSKAHREESKVMRILLKNFICNEALPNYLTSKKIRKELMRYNLKSIRIIFYDLNVSELE